ncbi:hydroxyacylglutathione hydrolase [Allochromatium palmeri]|uniref:Hydroxyacylglutathione hydrolase n=1 Tax=Allochromatium palmeri TaxID=231048 RepID=A0A6N8EFV8_9GAMM|nr:hydroxyacylglutathione hydrolase [Allochromatium palmeri]MTW21546.1 hydroxyacylglutathione hydrolase [Allochromatium palmeri]
MLDVQPIPAFEDNYIWLLTEGSGNAVVVDPGDAEPVLERLSAERLTLTSVLITHHHADHTGGLEALLAAVPTLEINGPDDDRIRALSHRRGEGETFTPAGLTTPFQVLEVPGHTSSHIAYLGAGCLFCGDTLFAAGCGRVFDGTFEQLAHSLERIAALPADTRCYCAHEYTQANLGFAEWVEPDSQALAERVRQVQLQRSRGQPTVPSRLDLERATNPFLRTCEPNVIAAAEHQAGRRLTTSAEVFTALRRWKDEHYD